MNKIEIGVDGLEPELEKVMLKILEKVRARQIEIDTLCLNGKEPKINNGNLIKVTMFVFLSSVVVGHYLPLGILSGALMGVFIAYFGTKFGNLIWPVLR